TSLFTYLPSICSLLLTRRPPPSLLFPYTTLFRSGIPLNLPVVSLGETLVRPTAMLWRNMAAMATEEMLRANPVDGVVLLGGCDKDRKSTRLNSSHQIISYAVFCLKKKTNT